MGKVIWSQSALRDIDFIAEYISRDYVYQASLFIKRLFNATERLKRFPLSGRVIPEISDPTCREIIYTSYRIMYRVKNDDIWITGVVHGSLDWNP